MNGVVYALCDPRTGEVRYVGITNNLSRRLKGHYNEARKHPRLHLHRWLGSLHRPPTHFILEECDTREELNDAERFWISWYRRCGFVRLTNVCDGGYGGGNLGHQDTVATRKKKSKSHLGVPLSDDHCLHKSLASKGWHHTPESRALISENRRGIPSKKLGTQLPDEHRNAIKRSWKPGGARRLAYDLKEA
jgi:hypothetical protein